VHFAISDRHPFDRELAELCIDPAKDALKECIAGLVTQNAQLAECRQALEKVCQRLKERLKSTEQELESCMHELQAKRDEVATFQQQREAIIVEATRWEREEQSQRIGDFQALILQQKETITRLEAGEKAMQATITRLEADAVAMQATITRLEAEAVAMQATITRLEAESVAMQALSREDKPAAEDKPDELYPPPDGGHDHGSAGNGFEEEEHDEVGGPTLSTNNETSAGSVRSLDELETDVPSEEPSLPTALRDSIDSSRVGDQSELGDPSLHPNSQHGSEVDASSEAQETPRRSMRIREKGARPAEIDIQRKGPRRMAQPRGRPRSQGRKGANS
jgi:chromosome segregation ATPase